MADIRDEFTNGSWGETVAPGLKGEDRQEEIAHYQGRRVDLPLETQLRAALANPDTRWGRQTTGDFYVLVPRQKSLVFPAYKLGDLADDLRLAVQVRIMARD